MVSPPLPSPDTCSARATVPCVLIDLFVFVFVRRTRLGTERNSLNFLLTQQTSVESSTTLILILPSVVSFCGSSLGYGRGMILIFLSS